MLLMDNNLNKRKSELHHSNPALIFFLSFSSNQHTVKCVIPYVIPEEQTPRLTKVRTV